jgi:hypothetical protein
MMSRTVAEGAATAFADRGSTSGSGRRDPTTESEVPVNPRQEAYDRVRGAYEVRVLEPSPPPVVEPPWFADDPVAGGAPSDAKPIVSPVTTGDLTWDDLCTARPALSRWCADRWLGAWRALPPIADLDGFLRTRAAWHALAEHVLSPARHAANGKIGLRFTKDGFGTPWFAASGPRQLRIRLGTIARDQDDEEVVVAATNLRVAAAFAGVTPGARHEVYEPTTTLDLDAPLEIHLEAAEILGGWFGFGASVLEQLRADASPGDDPSRVQLWPEHFDLSFDSGNVAVGSRGTFGASPGDAAHPEPYLYVTHWSDVPPSPFWNDDHFDGASLPFAALVVAEDQRATALDFLRRGRDVLRRTPG